MPTSIRALFAAAAGVLVISVITLGVKATDDGDPVAQESPSSSPTATASPTASPSPIQTESPEPSPSPTQSGTETTGGTTGSTGGTTTDGGTTGSTGATTGSELDDMPDTGGGGIVAVAGLIALGGAAGMVRRR